MNFNVVSGAVTRYIAESAKRKIDEDMGVGAYVTSSIETPGASDAIFTVAKPYTVKRAKQHLKKKRKKKNNKK
jgi:hypothetical protein